MARNYVYGLAVVTKDGKHRVLLINKTNKNFDVSFAGAAGGQLESVDVTTGFTAPTASKLNSDKFEIHGLSVAVITLP